MFMIRVSHSQKPEKLHEMPPVAYVMCQFWSPVILARLALVNHAICARYQTMASIEGSFAGSGEVYWSMGNGRWLHAEPTWRMPALPPRDQSEATDAILFVDGALRVIAASGEFGPEPAIDEVLTAAADDWCGAQVPLALHAEANTGRLHVLWHNEVQLAAADLDRARWSKRWEAVEHWQIARRTPKVHLFSPPAWSDLRVRPVKGTRERQRHVGAVTA